MVLYHFGVGLAEPVTHHLDMGGVQFQRRADLCAAVVQRAQRHGTGIELVVQAAAL